LVQSTWWHGIAVSGGARDVAGEAMEAVCQARVVARSTNN